jgi:hypothetical protein
MQPKRSAAARPLSWSTKKRSEKIISGPRPLPASSATLAPRSIGAEGAAALRERFCIDTDVNAQRDHEEETFWPRHEYAATQHDFPLWVITGWLLFYQYVGCFQVQTLGGAITCQPSAYRLPCRSRWRRPGEASPQLAFQIRWPAVLGEQIAERLIRESGHRHRRVIRRIGYRGRCLGRPGLTSQDQEEPIAS